MLEECEPQDITVCVYNALVVRGRIDRGISTASQMRVIAYEKGGLWYDAATNGETTEEAARSAAAAFVESKEADSPFHRGRVETRPLKLSRGVPIG